MATTTPGVWGIDIGQCALKAIRLELADGQVKATAFDYVEHPKILSQPDADPDQLTREALEQLLSRNNLAGDSVVISVPGQSGLARFVKLPPVEEKKIADIVRFEAKQQIPFPLEEVVWDFQKIGSGEVTDGFALETEIGLFAMKRDMVNRYLQHFRDVGVEVHAVQMAPLAVCNYAAYDLLKKGLAAEGGEAAASDGKKTCVVALDLGTDSSNLVITDGDRIMWQRPIPLGGNHFTRALTKDLKLTFAKAEHTKGNAVKSPDLKKILAALRPVLTDFVGEIQRSLGYFTNSHRDAQVEFMIGLGNAFRLPGLQKFLQEKLQLDVRKLAKLERLAGDDVINAPTFVENLPSFPVAYGLALQGLNQTRLTTNLLPGEIRVERLVRAKKPWAVAAAATLLLAIAGLTFGRNLELQAVNKPEIEQEKKKAEAIITEIAKYKAEADAQSAAFNQSVAAINRINAGIDERPNWILLLQYLNETLPMPDGTNVSEHTRHNVYAKRDFVTNESKDAYRRVLAKQFAKSSVAPPDPGQVFKEQEFIRQNLIRVEIEGINALYSEDLSGYFQKIYAQLPELPGMSAEEKKQVAADPGAQKELYDKLPTKGWVIEVRGYTYHKRKGEFVINTYLENLAMPGRVNIKLSPEMQDRVSSRLSHFLFVNEQVDNPEEGTFQLIGQSFLRGLVGGPAPKGAAPGADRGGWNPLGEIAGGGGTGNIRPNRKQFLRPKVGSRPAIAQPGAPKTAPAPAAPPSTPRQEFVILMIWREKLADEGGAPPPPPQ